MDSYSELIGNITNVRIAQLRPKPQRLLARASFGQYNHDSRKNRSQVVVIDPVVEPGQQLPGNAIEFAISANGMPTMSGFTLAEHGDGHFVFLRGKPDIKGLNPADNNSQNSQREPLIQFVVDLVDRYAVNGVESTSAQVVNYSGDLYNVDGSSNDPKIDGKKWKQLLKSYDVEGDCYVTNKTPEGNTHPQFNVGGHVTPNSNGEVAKGGTCYLMPLCSWHNNKKRDGTKFTHKLTKMLKLSGYMQGEPAATFQARLPSDDRFAIVYFSAGAWEHENLSDAQAADVSSSGFPNVLAGCEVEFYVLFERVRKKTRILHVVREARLPS